MDQSWPSSESEVGSRLDNGGNQRAEVNVNDNPQPVPPVGSIEFPETDREGAPLPSAQRRPTQQRPAQQREKALILVGDPGLGSVNVGRNFERAAKTRSETLRREGFDPIVQRVSSVTDMERALRGNGRLSRVEYYGHSSPRALNPGEGQGADTNLDDSNLNRLPDSNLKPGCRIVLYSCRAGRGHDSIAAQMAGQLGCTVEAYNGPTRFSTDPSGIDRTSPPPRDAANLYAVPERPGEQRITFEAPRRRSPHTRQ
jgi:hypothetical protein